MNARSGIRTIFPMIVFVGGVLVAQQGTTHGTAEHHHGEHQAGYHAERRQQKEQEASAASGGDHEHVGHHDHDHGGAIGPASEEIIKPQIPDLELVDQDGRTHRFFSDLVQGKIVLMNAVYTTCQGTCPMQSAIFSRVQDMLGDRVGKDVQMISVSLDPLTDTPERLKEMADRHRAGPGWLFLTGDREDVVTVLQAMDLYAANPEDHTPIASIGNEPAGLWMKIINLSAPTEIVSRIDYVKQLGDQRVGGTAP